MGGDGPKRTRGESDDVTPSRQLTLWGGSWALHRQKRAGEQVGGVAEGEGTPSQQPALPTAQHPSSMTTNLPYSAG